MFCQEIRPLKRLFWHLWSQKWSLLNSDLVYIAVGVQLFWPICVKIEQNCKSHLTLDFTKRVNHNDITRVQWISKLVASPVPKHAVIPQSQPFFNWFCSNFHQPVGCNLLAFDTNHKNTFKIEIFSMPHANCSKNKSRPFYNQCGSNCHQPLNFWHWSQNHFQNWHFFYVSCL